MNSLQRQFIQAFIEDGRWKNYLDGLGISLLLTIGALVLGVLIGVLIAVVRTQYDQNPQGRNIAMRFVNGICKIYTTVIRGTPMMVQLMIWGFVIFRSQRNLFPVAVLGLGLNSGAYVAEIIRSGIMSIDPGQMEAGRSLGLGYTQVMKSIIIPQAIKNILPALGNEMITLFKDTSLVYVLGSIKDLTRVANNIGARIYNYLVPLILAALMYLIIVMILTWLLGILERRLRRSDRT